MSVTAMSPPPPPCHRRHRVIRIIQDRDLTYHYYRRIATAALTAPGGEMSGVRGHELSDSAHTWITRGQQDEEDDDDDDDEDNVRGE
jgi:hypothetical protein